MINFQNYLEETARFFIGQLPIVGSALQIWDNVQSKKELNSIVNRLESLENDDNSIMSSHLFGSSKIRRLHGTIENSSSNPLASFNQLFYPKVKLNPKINYYSEIHIKPISGSFLTEDGMLGTALNFTDENGINSQPLFLHLISTQTEGFFSLSKPNKTEELGWSYIDVRSNGIYTFKIGRIDGITRCKINEVEIFEGRVPEQTGYHLGVYLEKDNIFEYESIVTIKN